MIVPKRMEEWLAHRAGRKRLRPDWGRYETKALELNRQGRDVAETFGDSVVRALIGFIDLKGFSHRVAGCSAEDVAGYLLPFLNRIANAVTATAVDGLVDKTIGDEVMAVVLDCDEEREVPMAFRADDLIVDLYALRSQLAATYPFRVGLAVGDVFIGQVEGEGYAEWSVFGEPVNLAKRLTDVPNQPAFSTMNAWGAVGVLQREAESHRHFDAFLRYAEVRGDAGDRPALVEVQDVPPLKGISPYRCALLVPGPNAASDRAK